MVIHIPLLRSYGFTNRAALQTSRPSGAVQTASELETSLLRRDAEGFDLDDARVVEP